MIKNLPANAGDTRDVGLIPGLGRSPGVENANVNGMGSGNVSEYTDGVGTAANFRAPEHNWPSVHRGARTLDS